MSKPSDSKNPSIRLFLSNSVRLAKMRYALTQWPREKRPRTTALKRLWPCSFRTIFLERMVNFDRELVQQKRESEDRFARIESILLEHSRVLAEHQIARNLTRDNPSEKWI